jgi:hypothetical protein
MSLPACAASPLLLTGQNGLKASGLVDQQLAAGSRFNEMDFASRNPYRNAELARNAKC